MTIKPIFAWYDLWVGAYWDADKRRLYVLPIPCCGLVFDFGPGKDAVWQDYNLNFKRKGHGHRNG